MAFQPTIMVFCDSGPYRHLRGVIQRDAEAWFPWGYRLVSISDSGLDRLTAGSLVEIWSVDDIRNPAVADPVTRAEVDFVSVGADYVQLTLRAQKGPCSVAVQDVIVGVRRKNSFTQDEVHTSPPSLTPAL